MCQTQEMKATVTAIPLSLAVWREELDICNQLSHLSCSCGWAEKKPRGCYAQNGFSHVVWNCSAAPLPRSSSVASQECSARCLSGTQTHSHRCPLPSVEVPESGPSLCLLTWSA